MSTEPISQRLRLVALIRISKDRDNEQSTKNQPFEINQWADAHGMDIVQTFTEIATSGFKNVPRPKLDEALAMVKNGLADGVIVWKISRFSRKGAKEIFRMVSAIESGDGFLVATSDGIDTRSAGIADIIKLTVIAELAKGESEQKSDFAASWHRGRLRGNNGVPLPPVGRRPFGYDRTPNALTINEAEAKVVRKIAADYLGGKSMRKIVADLNASGIRRDDPRPWTHRGVGYLLSSPTTGGGRIIAGEFVRGWDAVLDEPTWKAVAAKIAGQQTGQSVTPAWLITGIATCGKADCGGSIRAKKHARGYRYTCKKCEQSIRVDVADAVVESTVLRLLSGDGWNALRAQGKTHDASAIEFLTARLAHARTRWLDGKDSDTEFDATRDEINVRIDAIRSAPVVELPNVPDIAKAWPTMDLASKRQVVDAATKSIRILANTADVTEHDRVEVI